MKYILPVLLIIFIISACSNSNLNSESSKRLPSPKDLDLLFDGKIGGCKEYFIYNLNSDGTVALTIDMTDLGIKKEDLRPFPISYDVSKSDKLSISIYKGTSYEDPFCKNKKGFDISKTWIAKRGSIFISKSSNEIESESSYIINAELKDAFFYNSEQTEEVFVKSLKFPEVRVGWEAE